MRKTLMIIALAIPLTLMTPSGAAAWHCGFHCRPHCCFRPCFGGWCGYAPFGCFGCRPFCCARIGICSSFCWPSYCYSYAPVIYGPAVLPPVYYYQAAPAPYYPLIVPPVSRAANEPPALASRPRLNPETLVNELARLRNANPPPSGGPAVSPATVVVSLPADAKLLANGQALTTTSERRVFVTPDLEPGKPFQYTFTAEVVRNGKPVVISKKATVRAGEETQLQFDLPAAIASRK